MKTKRYIFLLIFITTILLLIIAFIIINKNKTNNNQNQFKEIIINNIKFKAEIADNYFSREKGLSKREKLDDLSGMLFIFDKSENHSIWMKDMKFSIDIIWLNENYQIIDITKNLKPESFPKTFSSDKPSQYVFEVNAGICDKYNITIGDYLETDTKSLKEARNI